MTAPIVMRLGTDEFPIGAVNPDAEYHYGDTRANRALHSTLTGESMATWGPRYIREAKAILKLGKGKGTLWERLAEGKKA